MYVQKNEPSDQRGVVPLIALIAASGLIVFILISFSASFKDQLFSYLFPKNASYAANQGQLQALTLQLLALNRNFSAASSPQKAQLLSQIDSIASEREQILKELIERNPGQALRLSLSTDLKKAMPEKIQTQIEEEVALEGTLEHTHLDDFDNKISTHYYTLKTADGDYSLHFTKEPNIPLGSMKAKVQGLEILKQIAVDNSITDKNFEVLSKTSSVLGATTSRKVLVLLFNWSDDTTQPWTIDQIRNLIFTGSSSVNNFYRENSFGKLELIGKLRTDGDVFGYITLPTKAADGCDATGSLDAAKANGIDVTGYETIVSLYVRGSSLCPFGAGGGGGNVISWGNISFYVLAHEFGHELGGSSHANSATCTENGKRVSISNSCTSTEYGDPFSIMAGSTKHNAGWYKSLNFLGWLNPENITTVSGGDNVYTLKPIEKLSAGPQVIEIPRELDMFGGSVFPSSYFLEYRQPYGFDNFNATDPVVNGVTIHLANNILDMTPDTASFTDSALGVGKTFTDTYKNISITTLSANATEAQVRVIVNPSAPCTRMDPSISVTPLSQWAYQGDTKNYTVTMTNNDTSGCAPATLSSGYSTPNGLSQTPGSINKSLSPGASASFTVALTAAQNLSEGFYSFTESVINLAVYKTSSTTANLNIQPASTSPSPTPAFTPVPTSTLAPSLAPTSTPTNSVSFGNIVTNTSANTVVINWTTNIPTTSRIVYGTSKTNLNLSTSEDTNLVASHSVTLTGLSKSTTYYYKLVSKNSLGVEYSSSPQQFRTKNR